LEGYLVFVCPRCGAVRYAKEGQKAAQCFRCGFRIPLGSPKTRILVKTRTVDEAIEAVRSYKMRLQK